MSDRFALIGVAGELAREKGPAPIMEERFTVTAEMLRKRPEMAADGWKALNSGKPSIFSGWTTKIQGVLANVVPGSVLAEQHRKMAEPGSADR